jgi:hypothetical protein
VIRNAGEARWKSGGIDWTSAFDPRGGTLMTDFLQAHASHVQKTSFACIVSKYSRMAAILPSRTSNRK